MEEETRLTATPRVCGVIIASTIVHTKAEAAGANANCVAVSVARVVDPETIADATAATALAGQRAAILADAGAVTADAVAVTADVAEANVAEVGMVTGIAVVRLIVAVNKVLAAKSFRPVAHETDFSTGSLALITVAATSRVRSVAR